MSTRGKDPRNGKQTLLARSLIALLGCVFLPTAMGAGQAPAAKAAVRTVDVSKIPLHFEPNQGQADPTVRYLTHAPGGTIYFTPSEIVMAVERGEAGGDKQASRTRPAGREGKRKT